MEEADRPRRLADVVREMRIAEADRLDAADREGESARQRLEQLADELSEVFEEAGGEEAGFDFQISRGAQPRLWIDAATHVVMAGDGLTYRILRDARGGRTVLGETDDVDDAADRVTRYIATRSLERERLLDEDAVAGTTATSIAPAERRAAPARGAPFGGSMAGSEPVVVRRPSRTSRFVRAIVWFALGALAGAGLLFLAYGERLGFENPVPGEYRRLYEPYIPPVPSDSGTPAATEGTVVVPVEPADPGAAEAGTEDTNAN